MYSVSVTPELDTILFQLQKRNKKQYEIIMRKVQEILENPHRYKNLRTPKSHLKRVHIDKHFVLLFSIDEESKTVILVDYNHHDFIYK